MSSHRPQESASGLRVGGVCVVVAIGIGWIGCAQINTGASPTPNPDADPVKDSGTSGTGGQPVVSPPDAGPTDHPPPQSTLDAFVFSDVATGSDSAVCSHDLKVVVRDFRGYAGTAGARHPDFEGSFTGFKGIVQNLIGADQKPVYAGVGPTPATTGPAEFDQWYRDVAGVNMRFDDVVLPLSEDPLRPKTFVYDNQRFFPINGRGWMDCLFCTDNFHFTTEIHIQFTYRGGEAFTFRGDDDVFLFINGHLAIDLGGVHPAQMATVILDDQAAALGITPNRSYQMDIFQAERHTTESTFRIETTLSCLTNVVIP